MSATLRIRLEDDPDGERVSRFRNLGEAVYSAFWDLTLASVDIAEVDAAIDCFHVRRIRTRHLGTVSKILHRLIRQHGFQDRVTVERT